MDSMPQPTISSGLQMLYSRIGVFGFFLQFIQDNHIKSFGFSTKLTNRTSKREQDDSTILPKDSTPQLHVDDEWKAILYWILTQGNRFRNSIESQKSDKTCVSLKERTDTVHRKKTHSTNINDVSSRAMPSSPFHATSAHRRTETRLSVVATYR